MGFLSFDCAGKKIPPISWEYCNQPEVKILVEKCMPFSALSGFGNTSNFLRT
jgi:hypothetical protein